MSHCHFPLQSSSSSPNKVSLSLLALLTALVSGCGGGSEGAPIAAQVPAPTVTDRQHSIPIQTQVTPPGLPAESPERKALDYLNRQRLTCGFGAMRHNTTLDGAGRRHAQYAIQNARSPLYHPHIEVAGLPGYTATHPTGRAVAAGYLTNGPEVGEVGAGGLDMFTAPIARFREAPLGLLPLQAVRDLSVAPYHAMHVFGPYTEVGMGVDFQEKLLPPETLSSGSLVVASPERLSLDHMTYVMQGYGMDGLGQIPPEGSGIRTYPCEGSVDVPPALFGEWTDPSLGPGLTPGRNHGLQPTGTTILVVGERNRSLQLQRAAITRVQTGESVGVYALRTRANDPMPAYYRNDWTGYVMPDPPLMANERYQVEISSSSGGVAFTQRFTFTTGVRSISPVAQ